MNEALARRDFAAAEATIAQAETRHARTAELAALRAKIDALPQHLQTTPRELLRAAETVIGEDDRGWRKATHPLRRQLGS